MSTCSNFKVPQQVCEELAKLSASLFLEDSFVIEREVNKKEGTVEDVAEKKQAVNGLVGRFTWRIENFSSLDQSKELYSSTFEIDENRWRLKLYPNYVDHLSVFLEVPDSASLCDGWSRTVKCSIALINQLDSEKMVTEEFEQEFSAKQSDRGCHLPLPHSKLHSAGEGYLIKDTCLIEAEITVVAQKEGNVNVAVKKQAKNDLVGIFTWKIENFISLDEQKLSSCTFAINGNRWRLILYPKGNNVDHLSVSVEVPDSASLPEGWSRMAKCSIAVINQLDSQKTVKREFEHQFTAKQIDWSCRSLFPLIELHSECGGYLVNGTCLIEVQISVVADKEGSENIAENNQLKDQFTWKIEKFTKLCEQQILESSIFTINGNIWRLRLYPKGSNAKDFLSVFFEVPDSDGKPDGWSKNIKCSIAVINQLDSNKTIKKEFEKQFQAKGDKTWGWSYFLPLSELHSKSGGYLVKDTCLIEAQVSDVANKPLDDATESVYIEAKSFLKSIPIKSCGPVSDATLEVPLFKDHEISAKECLNNVISIPLNDLVDHKHETAMIQTLSILSNKLSLFSDEQAKEIIALKAAFPKIIKDLRDLVQVKVRNQILVSTFEKTSNLLEDLLKTEEGAMTELEELNEREKELEAQLELVRSRKRGTKEERIEASKQTKQVYNVAKEQFCKIKGKGAEVDLANKKLENMKCKWAAIMQRWMLETGS